MMKSPNTLIGSAIRERLGLPEGPQKKKKKILTRKEKRQLERKTKRSKRISVRKGGSSEGPSSIGAESKSDQPRKGDQPRALKRPRPIAGAVSEDLGEDEDVEQLGAKKAKRGSGRRLGPFGNPTDPEDDDIVRLEKLLGVDKANKKKTAEKLNQEYELFEGISGGLGDFLLDLDDLDNRIKKGNGNGSLPSRRDDDDEEDDEESVLGSGGGHVIDDDEQERSDISYEEGEGEKEGESLDSADEDDENDVEEEEESVDAEGEEEEGVGQGGMVQFTYRPAPGEDIYGRLVDSAGAGAGAAKYVPPNRRPIREATAPIGVGVGKGLGSVDENSEAVRLMRREMNGQLNRLSEQTKDNVLRKLKGIFESNSVSVANVVLRDCLLAACSNQTQIMSSLIPLYAAMVAALHIVVGREVGAFVLESLALALEKAMRERGSGGGGSGGGGGHSLIGNKEAGNALLMLVYLYDLRVVHHGLVTDILSLLTAETEPLTEPAPPMGELEAELVIAVIEHYDPSGLKTVIGAVTRRCRAMSAVGDTRVRFLLEAVTDLKNNKSRRTQSANADVVRQLRRWLGTVKAGLASNGADAGLCLRVSLQDLLDADKRGRWWRAGARWAGREEGAGGPVVGGAKAEAEGVPAAQSSEEQRLLQLATKLRMSAGPRRSVFLVLMSSRDVADAFERIQRLQLRGRQDRDVVRVALECCGREKKYNAFYAELLCLFCSENRQFKTSVQFAYWDQFKVLREGAGPEGRDRRVVNQARLLAHLVCRFHVSLAVLKPVEVAELGPGSESESGPLLLFLAAFFMALFAFKMSEEEFGQVLDRVATSADFATVRDNVLLFLQRHLPAIPEGLQLEPAELKAMKRRRRVAVKTMEAMHVLDMVREEDRDQE